MSSEQYDPKCSAVMCQVAGMCRVKIPHTYVFAKYAPFQSLSVGGTWNITMLCLCVREWWGTQATFFSSSSTIIIII